MARTVIFIPVPHISMKRKTMFSNTDVSHEYTFKEKEPNTATHTMISFKRSSKTNREHIHKKTNKHTNKLRFKSRKNYSKVSKDGIVVTTGEKVGRGNDYEKA